MKFTQKINSSIKTKYCSGQRNTYITFSFPVMMKDKTEYLKIIFKNGSEKKIENPERFFVPLYGPDKPFPLLIID